MPLIYQYRIFPVDCLNNPGVLYLYGSNVEGWGKGGQAIIRDQPNAVGIPTKWRPGRKKADYFTDEVFRRTRAIILEAFDRPRQHVYEGGIVVCPLEGIGTGLAELPERAPETLHFIRNQLKALA